MPPDLAAYTSIDDDITAAMQQVLRSRSPQVHRGNGPPPPAANAKSSARRAGEPKRGLFGVAFDKLGPRNADSVPLPLLILAGLALLLIAAGAAGLVSRRLRARRVGPPAH